MRTQGTLTKWHESQGSGVISPSEGGADVFVHVSSMPHDGMRPRLGETLSYETEPGPDDAPRAVRVWRVGDRASVAAASRRRRTGARRTKIALALVVAAVVAYVVVDRIGRETLPGQSSSAVP